MVLPKPARILWADACRDGGSYELGFVDSEDRTWHLRLPVRLKHHRWWWSNERRAGYFPPVLRGPEDGTQTDGARAEHELDWGAASALHVTLATLIDDRIDMGGAARATEMLDHIHRRGEL